jgi:predicted ester cyclase
MRQDPVQVLTHAVTGIMQDGDIGLIDRLFAPDFVGHDTSGGAFDREAFTQGVSMMQRAFADRAVAIEDSVVEGDRIALRWRISAVHDGEFFGLPPTGRRIEQTGIIMARVADGQIAETWEVTDDAGLLRQLGALPEMQPAAASH